VKCQDGTYLTNGHDHFLLNPFQIRITLPFDVIQLVPCNKSKNPFAGGKASGTWIWQLTSTQNVPFTSKPPYALRYRHNIVANTTSCLFRRAILWWKHIGRCDRVVSTPASCSGGPGFKSLPEDQQPWRSFLWFSSVPPLKSRTVSQTGHDHFHPYKFFFIDHLIVWRWGPIVWASWWWRRWINHK
jgi:hypothetical protein